MPDGIRKLIPLASWAFVVAAFSAGTAWATARAQTREQDSRLERIEQMVRRVDSRVSEMYCADKPPGCR